MSNKNKTKKNKKSKKVFNSDGTVNPEAVLEMMRHAKTCSSPISKGSPLQEAWKHMENSRGWK